MIRRSLSLSDEDMDALRRAAEELGYSHQRLGRPAGDVTAFLRALASGLRRDHPRALDAVARVLSRAK